MSELGKCPKCGAEAVPLFGEEWQEFKCHTMVWEKEPHGQRIRQSNPCRIRELEEVLRPFTTVRDTVLQNELALVRSAWVKAAVKVMEVKP